MAAMALPIRELSASVTIDAARTQKKCLDVADSAQQSGVVEFVKLRVAAWAVGFCFDRLIGSQRTLINHLQALNTDAYTPEHFSKLCTDLNNLTAMTFAVVDSANEIPKYSDEWRPKLEAISEMAAHVDNFAESYRIASDSVCISLMATIAETVISQAAVPAH